MKKNLQLLNLFSLFITGYITVSILFVTIYQLQPFVGNNSVTTSIISIVFLFSLAVGFRSGACYGANLLKKLKLHFVFASLWLGIGLSYFVTENFFYFFTNVCNASLVFTFILYLTLIVSPIIYSLAHVVPISLNLMQQPQKNSAHILGVTLQTYALGALIGVLANLLLISYLGIAWVIFIDFSLMGILAILLAETLELVLVSSLAGCGLMIYGFNLDVANQVDFGLPVSHAARSTIPTPPLAQFKNKDVDRHEIIGKFLFQDLALRNKKILVLTGSDYIFPEAERYGNQVSYVNLEPDVKLSACDYLENLQKAGLLMGESGNPISNATNKYDVIVSDVHNDKTFSHPHLLTQAHMKNIHDTLTENGLAVFNVLANPNLSDRYSKRMDNTIRTVFKSCMVIPREFTNRLTNIIYLCHKSSEEVDSLVYSHNKNSSQLDFLMQ